MGDAYSKFRADYADFQVLKYAPDYKDMQTAIDRSGSCRHLKGCVGIANFNRPLIYIRLQTRGG